MNAEDQALVALFQGLDTPGVSDAMDKLGLHGQALGIMPLADYTRAVVGPAFTVKYVPASDPPGTVGDFIDEVAPGDVVVIDNDGRTDCTVWGDILTQYAGQRGIAATVIDGVCRDVGKALGDGYPMFSAGRFMRTGKDRAAVPARWPRRPAGSRKSRRASASRLRRAGPWARPVPCLATISCRPRNEGISA